MPGLVACNRRWDIASDDLMFPAFFECWIRLFWLIGIAVVFNTHKLSFDCSHGVVVQSYYIGMLAILSCHLVFSILIVAVSMRGTITNSTPRKYMPMLVYFKLILFVPELVWTILGTYWAFDASSNCESFVVTAVKITAIAGWVLLFSLVVALLIVFDPLGSLHSAEDTSSAAVKLWETRCRLMCCCAGCDDQNADAFGDTARLLADLFKDVDAVPTDIAAGLILVQDRQKLEPTRFTLQPYTPPQPRITSANDPPASSLNTVQPVVTEQPSTSAGGEGLLVHIDEPPATVSQGVATDRDNASADTSNGHGGINPSVIQPCESPKPPPCQVEVRPQPWMTVERAAHFMQFSLGTYSWPVYMYMNLCCGLCDLCGHCSCCSGPTSSQVVDDNCCGCHAAALLKITGVQHTDIIYASFNNKIYETPFFVALDHTTKSVVVAVRGTMSLRDALTDMTAGTESCTIEGLGEQFVHKGILQAAKYIENTLNNMDLLTTAFTRCPDYKLVVTGHSLGAGAATLLAILLRPKYNAIQCFGFAPPGWLLSLPLTKYTESFVCSVVIGDDLIPRLGVRTLERLKTSILQEIRDCDLPKYKIFAGGCWQAVCGRDRPRSGDVEVGSGRLLQRSRVRSYTEEPAQITQAEQQRPRSFQDQIDNAIQESNEVCYHAKDLYMPGTVLYLMEEEPSSDCCDTPVYRPVWAKAEHFSEICVNPKMLRDHLPDVVLRALKETAKDRAEARHVLLQLKNVQMAQ